MHRHLFAGSGTLTRFLFRRDRVRLPLWVLGLAAFVVALPPVFENLIMADGGNAMFAIMMQNPAMVAIAGPVYGVSNYHTGAAYANMMLIFCVLIAGAMNIFLITRHTRQDEELGRLEVIRSLPVGRLANLAAALVAAVVVNVVLGVLSGLGLYLVRETGMTFAGCMLFGAALTAIGLFFAALTAVFCQMTANNRTATALSLMAMLLLYMVRAVGDISSEALARLSPLGLVMRAQIFVQDFWWPVWWIVGISAVLAVVALGLARMRDLGQGLIPAKMGKRHAGAALSSPFGLAWTLLRTSALVWAVSMFVLAGMYGSVFGELERFLGSNTMLTMLFAADPSFSLTEQFIGMLAAIMAMLAALPSLSAVHRVASEERAGHAEHLLGRSVSRYAQLAAYSALALGMSVVFQLLTALGFWSVGSVVLDTLPPLSTFVAACCAYLPAIWVFIGISMALVAFLPGKTYLSFVYLGYSFVAVYLGVLVNFPEWTRRLTPFGYIPNHPIESITAGPLLALGAIAVLLAICAFIGYRRRDVQTQ